MEMLEGVRNWKQWSGEMRVTPYHAFMTRNGLEAPHSFSWKLRRDLTAAELAWLGDAARAAGTGGPADVFCLVKNFIKDTHLQQAPVLAVTAGRAALPGPAPAELAPLPDVPEERRVELRKLADVIQQEFGMVEGANYLRRLASRRGWAAHQRVPLPWLQVASRPELPLAPTANPHFGHLPAASWDLRVRFSRLG